MKKRIIGFGVLSCCILLSGCSAITEHGKYYFSAFAWMIDFVQEERKHDCDITVKDANGEVLYVSNNKEVMDYFADLVEKLDEEDLELSCQGEVLYEYIMRDNDKKVSFYFYEPGNMLSCGVGGIQVYFNLPDDMKEILMNPESWFVTE